MDTPLRGCGRPSPRSCPTWRSRPHDHSPGVRLGDTAAARKCHPIATRHLKTGWYEPGQPPLPRWLKNQHTWDAAHSLGTGRDGAFRTAKPCIPVQFRAWPRQNFSEGWPHQPPRATTGRPAQAKPRRTPRNFCRFAAFKAGPALLYALRAREVLFPGSSAVEQPAVNRLVAGSNPARGANKINNLRSPAERYCALWIRPGYGYGYDEPRAF
jgi:hypothetical protein